MVVTGVVDAADLAGVEEGEVDRHAAKLAASAGSRGTSPGQGLPDEHRERRVGEVGDEHPAGVGRDVGVGHAAESLVGEEGAHPVLA